MAAKISSGGSGKRGQLDVNSDPNVIPFIDVMLVLLIIFMIAAPISSVDIAVEMPKAKIVPSKRPPRPTWISLQDNFGDVQVYVMNEESSFELVGEKTLEEWSKNSPTLNFEEECRGSAPNPYCRVYIRADGTTAYRNVVRVMNRLQDKGFTLIGLVAEDRRG